MHDLTFRVEDLRIERNRESVQALSARTVEQAVRHPGAFEIGVQAPMTDHGKLIYVLSGRTHPDGVTHLTESYYPDQPPRDNPWMYADTKPERVPVVRHYAFDGPQHVAGWVQSRLDALFAELARRYPDFVKAPTHER